MKRFFKALWAGWKKFAHKLGVFNTKVILTITYFIIMAIASIITTILRRDLLDRKFKEKPTFWIDREPYSPTLEDARRQF